MTWTRHPPESPHTERSLRHEDPFAIVFRSAWEPVWCTLTDHDTEDTDDLAAFCEAYGLGVVSEADQAWAKGESE